MQYMSSYVSEDFNQKEKSKVDISIWKKLLNLQYERCSLYKEYRILFHDFFTNDSSIEEPNEKLIPTKRIITRLQEINIEMRNVREAEFTEICLREWIIRLQNLEQGRFNQFMRYQQLVTDHINAIINESVTYTNDNGLENEDLKGVIPSEISNSTNFIDNNNDVNDPSKMNNLLKNPAMDKFRCLDECSCRLAHLSSENHASRPISPCLSSSHKCSCMLKFCFPHFQLLHLKDYIKFNSITNFYLDEDTTFSRSDFLDESKNSPCSVNGDKNEDDSNLCDLFSVIIADVLQQLSSIEEEISDLMEFSQEKISDMYDP